MTERAEAYENLFENIADLVENFHSGGETVDHLEIACVIVEVLALSVHAFEIKGARRALFFGLLAAYFYDSLEAFDKRATEQE